MKRLTATLVSLLAINMCFAAMLPESGRANDHEYVDMGLSVKWATCNVGASTPEDYGDYFAWGEVATKSNYWLDTYSFRISGEWFDETTFSKYNCTSGRGPVDNKARLEMSDDVANKKWGGSWRIPTQAEWEELRDNCNWTWTSVGDVEGYKVTSKKNGNSIFLPAAGGRVFDSLNKNQGSYWSSTLSKDDPNNASSIRFGPKEITVGIHGRHLGLSVRPVL